MITVITSDIILYKSRLELHKFATNQNHVMFVSLPQSALSLNVVLALLSDRLHQL